MNKYTDEQIEYMKARLLANITTVVIAEVDIIKGAIPEIRVLEDVMLSVPAKFIFDHKNGLHDDKLATMINLGFRPGDTAIEEAMKDIKETIYRMMEELDI